MADEMFTTDAPSRPSMWGTASWVRRNAVVTLKWNAFSKAATLVSRKALGIEPPALLTTTSMPPKASTARSTRLSSTSSWLTSQGMTSASPPEARTSVATSSSWLSVRAASTTLAPTSA